MSICSCFRVIGLIAALATDATPARGQNAPAQPSGALTVQVGDRTVILSRADLGTLPRHTIRMGSGADTTAYSGIALWDVLQRASVVPATASGRQRAVMYVRLGGADGQQAVLALVEVDPSFSAKQILLADRLAGQLLDSVEGPWRVIIPDDLRHARWIRGLVKIVVDTLR